MPAKSECVAKNVVHFAFLGFVESEIDIGVDFRIKFKLIDGWGNNSVIHR